MLTDTRVPPVERPARSRAKPTGPVLLAGSIDVRGLDSRAVERELSRGLGVAWAPLDPALSGEDLDDAIRGARALVLLADRLDEPPALAGPLFELATRARQAGVPAFAVAADSSLSAFDARMLDLQMVLTAGTPTALEAAGQRVANAL